MLPRIAFRFENASDLLTCVFGVPFIDDVPKRREVIICLVVAIHIIVHRYESYILLRQHYFGIVTHHYVVPTEPRHIFHDNRTDASVVHVLHHSLKVRTVKVRSRIAVVHVKPYVSESVLFRICG